MWGFETIHGLIENNGLGLDGTDFISKGYFNPARLSKGFSYEISNPYRTRPCINPISSIQLCLIGGFLDVNHSSIFRRRKNRDTLILTSLSITYLGVAKAL